jgi:homocitrate synthase
MAIGEFALIESTLREGEQFVGANFTTGQKVDIAQALDEFGVEYIELTSPAASPQSLRDCKTIAGLGLRCKVLTHVRCTMDDAKLAADTGVNGIDIVIGASSILRQFSHGKSVVQIIDSALEVIDFIKSRRLEVRFSTEDSFRSDIADLMEIYQAVDRVGVTRVGIADTVGIATPLQVTDLVRRLRSVIHPATQIEFHGHNDSGCAIANSYCALEAGATHVDTSVLGIGERNGITSLGGLIARLYTVDRRLVAKYRLKMLRDIENMVADLVGIGVPFNNYITGITACTHKAGIHAKAVLNNPETYEAINPRDFGLTRYISIAHKLTGWNAIKARAEQLGLNLSDEQIKEVTAHIKSLADTKPLELGDVDSILREWTAKSEHVAEPQGEQITWA